MVKYATRFLLIIGLIIGFGVSITAQEDEPPYIYYYSDILNAFVIERADGTDSRIIGQGVTPEEHNIIHSMDWSPSGEWMSWVSREASLGNSPYKSWVISTDGNERLTFLDEAYEVAFTEWSPTQDFLFAIYTTQSPRTVVACIFDAANNRFATKITYHSGVPISEFYPPKYGVWARDGSAAYYLFSDTMLILMGTDGTTESWDFGNRDNLIDFHDGRWLHRRYVDDRSRTIEWVITDITTDESKLFEFNESENEEIRIDYNLMWNPDGDFALVNEYHCEENTCHFVATRLLDWNTGIQQDLPVPMMPARNWGCSPYCRNIYSWWSPSGEVAILFDEGDKPVLFNATTGKTHSIDLEGITRWRWVEDDTLILGYNRQSFYYQFAWDIPSPIQLIEFEENEVYQNNSPDGTYIGILESISPRILNIHTGEQFHWVRHSGSDGHLTVYLWNEYSQWLFTSHSQMGEGGIGYYRGTMIININDSMRRELTYCYSLCAGFLPDHVLPHLPPGQPISYNPDPIYTLPHNDWVYGVAWSPDGNFIASCSADSVYIWDMSDDEPILVDEFTVDFGDNRTPYICNNDVWWEDETTILLDGFHNIYRLDIQTGEGTVVEDYSPQNRYEFRMAEGGQNRLIIDPETETTLATVPTTDRAIWSQDRTSILFYGGEGTFYHWNGDTIHILESPHQYFGVDRMDYNIESDLMASNRRRNSWQNSRMVLWDVSTGQSVGTINWFAWGISFSPDGTLLAAAGTQYVTIWDMTPYIQTNP